MDHACRQTAVLLALTTWIMYAASATGTLMIDPFTRFSVAENLFRTGSVALEGPTKLSLECDGRHYSVFFPGQSIVFLPVAAVSVAIEAITDVDPDFTSIGARFIACEFLMTAFAALSVLGHIAVLRRLGVRAKVAIASGVMLAFGSLLWVWGTNGSEESTLCALAIWTFWALLDARDIGRSGSSGATPIDPARAARFANRIGLAGVLIAFGLIHRSTFVGVGLGAAIYAAPILLRERSLAWAAWRRLAAWTVAIVGILAIVPFYDWVRFGDPLDMGYSRFHEPIGGLWANPLLTDLAGHLVSPGESVFLYVPWLILLPISLCLPAVRRRMGALFPVLLLIIAVHLLIYSLHTYWSGAFGWGVRFHVSLMALLFVPIAVMLDHLRPAGAMRAALASLSILVQVAGISLNTGLENFQHPDHFRVDNRAIPEEAAWTWHGSQIRLRVINIAKKLRGEELELDEDRRSRPTVTQWNLFPIRAGIALNDQRVVGALWVLWSLLTAMGLVFAWRTLLATRRLTDEGPRPRQGTPGTGEWSRRAAHD